MKFIDNMINNTLYRMGLKVRKIYPKGSTAFVKEHFKGKKINAVEIGVFRGENAKSILDNLNIKKLYLIDSYEDYEDYNNDIWSKRIEEIEEKAHKRLKYYNNIIWLKGFSNKMIKEIKERIDFIYIDGNHNYPYVIDDIRKSWEILKNKGILAGHDFELEGVNKAIIEFTKEKDLNLNFGKEDWWIIKKEIGGIK